MFEEAFKCVIKCVIKSEDRCFKLSSGKLSPYYIDLRRILFGDPKCLDIISQVLIEKFLKYIQYDFIACKALGAVPLAVSLSLKVEKPIIVLRERYKDYGLKGSVVGPIDQVYGKYVVIVDDVATTGNTILEVAKVVRDSGGIVDKAIVIVDREEGAREFLKKHNIELLSLFKRSELGISDEWLRSVENICREVI